MPSLQVIDDERRRQLYELDGEEVLVGRMPTCAINIGGAKRDVSRRHARLTRVRDAWFVEDLKSRNHTFVNGIDIFGRRPRALRHGDRIRIASHELLFDDPDAPTLDSGSVIVQDEPATQALSSVSLSLDKGVDDRARLSVLLEVTRCLSKVRSLDEALDATLKALFRIFPSAGRGVIGFMDGDEFVPKWWRLREGKANELINVSRRVVQRVAKEKEAILIDNAASEFPGDGSVHQLHIQSLMCAPLMDADGNVFGVFQVDSGSTSGFIADDLAVMATVAIQASMAINFARLHEEGLKQKVIENDLKLAREVQKEFLPAAVPNIPGYDFAHDYRPARFIGGDYFDYVPLGCGKLAIVLADVGGKGAPAALHMARMSMETRACLHQSDDPVVVISELNRRLSAQFATFLMCILDPTTHVVTFANAGHRSPLRRRRGGSVEALGKSLDGYPFGVQDDAKFEQATFELLAGESVIVLSDGFEDAYNGDADEYFGIDRIKNTFEQSGASPSVLVSELVRQVDDFAAETTQLDDMCIVAWTRLV